MFVFVLLCDCDDVAGMIGLVRLMVKNTSGFIDIQADMILLVKSSVYLPIHS